MLKRYLLSLACLCYFSLNTLLHAQTVNQYDAAANLDGYSGTIGALNVPCVGCIELIQRRTLKSRTFYNPKDPTKLYIQQGFYDIFYKSETGELKPIDPTPTEQKLGLFVSQNQPIKFSYDVVAKQATAQIDVHTQIKYLSNPELIIHNHAGENEFFSKALTSKNLPVLNGNQLIVKDFFNDVELHHTFKNSSTKTNYVFTKNIVPERCTNGTLTLSETLTLPPNSEIIPDKSTGYYVDDKKTIWHGDLIIIQKQKILARIKKLVVYDAGLPNRHLDSINLRYKYNGSTVIHENTPLGYHIQTNDNQTVNLRLVLPANLFLHPQAVYPITVDPEMIVYGNNSENTFGFTKNGLCAGNYIDVTIPAKHAIDTVYASLPYFAQGNGCGCFLFFCQDYCRMNRASVSVFGPCGQILNAGCDGNIGGTCTLYGRIDRLFNCVEPPATCLDYPVRFELRLRNNSACGSDAPCATDCFRISPSENPILTFSVRTVQTFIQSSLTLENQTTICQGEKVVLLAEDKFGVKPYKNQWRWQDGESNNRFIEVSPNQTTTYAVTTTDACNNTTTFAHRVVVNPRPSYTASVTNTSGQTASDGRIVLTNINPANAQLRWSTGQLTPSISNLTFGIYTVTVTSPSGCSTTQTFIVNPNCALIATPPTLVNLRCNGSNTGNITVNATSAQTLSYNLNGGAFQSSPVFSNLAAGSYTLRIRDASGCEEIQTATLISPSALQARATTVSALCGSKTGRILVQVQGGTVPYQYIIDAIPQAANEFNNLTQGQYTVTVSDANGCTTTVSVSVSGSDSVKIQPVVTQTTCNAANGRIVANVTGGTAPFQYALGTNPFQVSNVFNNLAPSTYILRVRDKDGCIGQTTVEILPTKGVNFTATSKGTTCGAPNGEVDITVTEGNAPYRFALSNTLFATVSPITGVPGGSYTLTVTDANGCTTTANITVPTSAGFTINRNVTQPTCGKSNGVISLRTNGGTPPFSYNIGQGSSMNAIMSGLSPGNYVVTVTDANGCTATAQSILNPSRGIEAEIATTAATCGQSNGQIRISVTAGRQPIFFSLNDSPRTPNHIFSNLAGGSYKLTIFDSGNCDTTYAISIDSNSDITLSAEPQDTRCGLNNGMVRLRSEGGTTPIVYTFNGTTSEQTLYSNLNPGFYTFTATDANQCSKSISLEIKSSLPVGLTIAEAQNPTCGKANGLVRLAATNGTPPYSYQINNNTPQTNAEFNNLGVGEFSFKVTDAAGCEALIKQTFEQSHGVIANLMTVQTTCGLNNGQIEIDVEDGAVPLRFIGANLPTQTNGFFRNLRPGLYTITVTDAKGCDTILRARINPSFKLQIGTIAVQSTTCGLSNGRVLIEASAGTPPYTYQIGNQTNTTGIFSDLRAGNLTLTIRDANNCRLDTTLKILASRPIVLRVNALPSSCGLATGTITALPGNGIKPYRFSLPNRPQTPDSVFKDLPAGEYIVTVTDSVGCTAFATTTVKEVTVSAPALFTGCVNEAITLFGGVPEDGLWRSETGTVLNNNIFIGTKAGDYTVQYIQAACTTNAIIRLNATTLPQKAFSICQGFDAAQLNSGIPARGTWTSTGIRINPDGTFIPARAGQYLAIYQAAGCKDTMRITVYPQPTGLVNIRPDSLVTVVAGRDAVNWAFNPSSAVEVPIVSYTWRPGNNLKDTTTTKPNLAYIYPLPNQTFSPSVFVTDSRGCSAIFELGKVSTIQPANIALPTAFTPNNDGFNDTYYFVIPFGFTHKIYIYDRFGSQVFTNRSDDDFWRGDYQNNGKLVPEGVYVFHFQLKNTLTGEFIEQTGTVTVLY